MKSFGAFGGAELRGVRAWSSRCTVPSFLERFAACGSVLLAAAGAVGCSEGDLNPNDAVAGSTSNGGSTANNGGSGNATANGGSTVSNGGSTNAGSGGGGNEGPSQTFTFATGLEGFAVNYYCSAPPGATEPGTNCVQVDTGAPPPAAADAGVDGGDAAAGEPPAGPEPINNEFVVLAHDPAEGSPDPGSARLTIQFQQAGQMAQLAFNTPNTDEGALNLSGKTVTAMVRADVAGATAKMYMKATGTYIYADSGQAQLVPGMWVPLTFAANSPAFMNPGYVATDIRELGISFETVVAALTPITIHVDTVQY